MLGVTRAALPDAFDFESLRALIDRTGAGGVEAVVAGLPEDLRSQYTLVFASRSLQGASWSNPRAVLFGSAARLVITFNGEPSQRGYSALETMEFSAAANRFLFREISFATRSAGYDVRISDPNPARCAACHGDPARPIWDSAPLWPGVYGERYGSGLSGRELQGMKAFLALQASHARYRHLAGAGALAERETYVASSRTRYAGGAVEPPNARFSALLATYNVRAILSQLAAQPAFAAHLDLLVAASDTGCGALEDFYPDVMRIALAVDYKEFAAAARAADRRQLIAKSARHDGRGSAHSELVAASDLTPLRYVVERDLGVSTQRWTLALEKGSFDLSAPAGTLTLAEALRARLSRADTTLADAAAYRSFGTADKYCAHLRRASVDSLNAWYASHQPPVMVSRAADPATLSGTIPQPPLVKRCAACHGGDVAPDIPFTDPMVLAPRLIAGGYPHGRLLDEILFRLAPEAGADRMPRGMNIDPEERQALERYFIAVAAGGRSD
jgi:hypothetical protein